MIQRILGTCSFVLSVAIGTLLCGQNLPKRSAFWLRCILLSAAACPVFHYSDAWIVALPIPEEIMRTLRLMECLILFAITVLLILMVYQCKIQEAMFCATVGYCMEHIAHEFCSVAKMFVLMAFPADTVFLVLVTAGFYYIMNKYGLKHTDPGKIVKDSPMQLVAFLQRRWRRSSSIPLRRTLLRNMVCAAWSCALIRYPCWPAA